MCPSMDEDLASVERVEQLRRSAGMLPPRAPCLNREQAVAVFAALIEALCECRRLRS